MKKYKVKTITTPTGESFPLLINSDTGIPDIYPTLFILTQVRARGKAAATVKYILNNISFFKLLLERYNLSEKLLTKRFEEGRIFQPYELEGIVEDCRFEVDEITKDMLNDKDDELPFLKNFSQKSLEKFRGKNSFRKRKFVARETAGNRLRTIRDYIIWMANMELSRAKPASLVFLTLKDNIADFREKIDARIPSKSSGSLIDGKEGLTEEEETLFVNVINRKSEDNPFRGEFLKSRNEVIFLWLLTLGMRKGELLNVKISDINFRSKRVHIRRRADDIDDPRTDKPNVKTRGRLLDISDKIMEITEHYILEHRSKIRGAKKHEYLIVSDKDGSPLGLEAVAVTFRRLRTKFPELPSNFSAHILRHTWNGNFSKWAEKNGISEEKEQQYREYLMGWRPGSSSAENYLKRYIRQEANEAIRDMGEQLFTMGDKK
jgi:integrase